MSTSRFFLAFAITCGIVFAQKQPITESDLLKIARVTEVQVTPDGSLAVYGVQTIYSEPAATAGGEASYGYRTNIWSMDLRDANARPVQLAYGDKSDGGLAISPDGMQLAFVRLDPKKHPQVWVMPLGGPGEPRMVTDMEDGATSPRWRQDSLALLVTSAVPIRKLPNKPDFALERPGREWFDYDRDKENKAEKGSPDGDLRAIRNWLEHNSEHDDPSDLTRMDFLGETALNGEFKLNELYRVDLGAEPKAVRLTKSFRDHLMAEFSPAGDRIVFVSTPESKEHPDRLDGKSALWVVNADGSGEQVLLSSAEFNFRQPQFTRDGQKIVFAGSRSDEPTYRQEMVGRCDLDGSHLEWLTDDAEAGVQQIHLDEQDHIYFTRNYHGGEPLFMLSPEKTLVDVPFGVTSYAVGGGKTVYARVSAANPNELFLRSKDGTRQLTRLNDEWLAKKTIVMPEEHWIMRPDGMKMQYWVMRPANADAGKKYPWVVDMHGGPSAMWGPGEFSMWHEFQIFCSFGYGVVYGNPRGSSGYGFAFQKANYKDWGDGPMSDIMAMTDDALAHESAMDKDRLFLTGGSYAGYLTAWMVGHTDRFKAAAALRGVYDLATFFGEGNAYRLVPDEFGGYPWEPETRKLLDKESPISYVADIKTPLLIIHGSADNRTGIVQGQMLFRALKQLRRPVEYVRYPGASHEITRSGQPLQRMDHMLRIIEFFERYARNDAAAPRVSSQTSAQ